MAENKTRPVGAPDDAWLQTVPDKRRADTVALIERFERLTGEPATLWGGGIVGFGSYHYVYESGREGDMCRVGFAPRKSKLVVYLMDGFEEREALLARLGKHSTGASCLYLNKLADVDLDVLDELVKASLAEMARRYPA